MAGENKVVKKMVLWLLVISCMVMIFAFSAQPSDKSNEMSSTLLYKIMSFFGFSDSLQRSIDPEAAAFLEVFIRKAAHFSVYALLGCLTYLLVRIGYEKIGVYSFGAPSLFCVLYAISDEIHQLFVPGRSGQVIDVCIDFSGAVVGICITWIVCRAVLRSIKNG